ncbi:MAG: flagellin [Opitutae bacterium]|jgi:flagellin-like hook-associated protein FlgL|nr:flagellin [Opitutae bacterium]MBT5911019.1 flagellin [Opitutae bacterium]MBT6851594.1 flagellin [Opitutae bacterium]MBT7923976.1 flagellin [Opitutae bacterium]
MQLTNYGFIESRGNYISARSNYERPMERLSTGLKINHSRDDVGALRKSALQRVENTKVGILRTNLQNALSYTKTQDGALEKVGRIYERMGTLAHKAMDVTVDDQSRSDLNDEYQMLEGQLSGLLSEKFNGISLFTKATGCTEPEVTEIDANFDAGLNETLPATFPAFGAKTQANPDRWVTTQDVETTDGTLTLDVNGGRVSERYIVQQGTTTIFDTGWWATAGSAYDNDYDRFVIDFGKGKDTAFEFVPRDTGNNTNDNTPDGTFNNESFNKTGGVASGYLLQLGEGSTAGLLGKKYTTSGGPLTQGQVTITPAPGDSTELTIEVQSTSLFQASADFKGVKIIEPVEIPALEVVVNEEGEIASFEALGFSRLSGTDISTRDNAQAALERLLGENGEATKHGEIHCLMNGQRAEIGKSMRRLELEIERLENKTISGEKAVSRIEDADMAQEATKFATQSLKMELAANIMSRVTRLTDVLLPLATQRVGGSSL